MRVDNQIRNFCSNCYMNQREDGARDILIRSRSKVHRMFHNEVLGSLPRLCYRKASIP